MKTDLTTSNYQKPQLKSGLAKPEAGLKDSLKKAPETSPIKTPSSNPDYKVELSSAKPTVPSTPEVPKLDLKEAVKTEAKAEIKDEVKTEIVKKPEPKDGSVKRPAIIFIKGLDLFSSPSKSEGGYAGVGRLAESVEGSRIYGWDQKDEILKEIKKVRSDQKVILIGHSLGGDTAVEIANSLDSLEEKFRPVDLLVTMDSIGFNNDIIPQNVKKHLNIFGENDAILNDGPHVARRHEKTDVKNILSTDDHTDLDDDKEMQYEIVNLIQETLKA